MDTSNSEDLRIPIPDIDDVQIMLLGSDEPIPYTSEREFPGQAFVIAPLATQADIDQVFAHSHVNGKFVHQQGTVWSDNPDSILIRQRYAPLALQFAAIAAIERAHGKTSFGLDLQTRGPFPDRPLFWHRDATERRYVLSDNADLTTLVVNDPYVHALLVGSQLIHARKGGLGERARVRINKEHTESAPPLGFVALGTKVIHGKKAIPPEASRQTIMAHVRA